MAKKKDFTEGDHSFKNWFRIMKENNYITIAVIALVAVIIELWNLGNIVAFIGESTTGGAIAATICALIPVGMLTIVSIKGLYQKWKNLKEGRSR